MKLTDLEEQKDPNENIDPEKIERIKNFVRFCFKKLKLKNPPRIRFAMKNDVPALGYFEPHNRTITVVVKNRHQMDIMRTLAHELVHLKQSEMYNRELDGETGSDDENEANAQAGVLLRIWGQNNPEYFTESVVTEEHDKKYYLEKALRKMWEETKDQ